MGLYFYKLNSPYPEDVTKNCRLTVNEIDSNFLNLKDEDIKSIGFDCESKTITLTRNNGEEMQVDLTCVLSGIDKHFDVKFEEESGCTGSGVLKFVWEEDGNTYESTIKGLITKDKLGNFIMTEAITDGTVIGNGKDESPLGLNPVEQTGHYKPVKDLIDMTNGESLPENKGIGDRYLTKEHIDEYGHLYTIAGVKEIEKKLSNGWRIPTKADWDNMLNAIEPCAYRNHDSVHCHVQLGKIAGKELKTTDWPYDPATSAITDDTSYLFDEVQPEEKPINTKGTNKFGFAAVPGGFAYEPKGEVQKFGEFASFWTSTQIMPEVDGDYFAKTLTYNMAGAWQSAECPFDLRSLRLVKDYNGSNARETAYIGGKYYEEVLMPSLNTEHGYAIWTKENIDIDVSSINQLRYKDFGDSYVINEWTGEDWERKIMPEGAVVVINKQQDCEHQPDTEYRLVGDDLIATDDLVYQRLMLVFTKIIDDIKKQLAEETANRIASDNALSAAIDTEREDRISADTALSAAIDTEIERAMSAESALSAATSADAVTKANGYSDEKNSELEAKAAASANTAYTNATSYTENAITDVNKEINTEKTAREEAIRNVTELTNAESRRALSAETALSTRINSEADTRHNEDEKLSNSITSATQDLTTKIGNVKDLVTGETNDRQDADRTLQTHIDNEQSARIAKDLELSQSISEEAISREIAVNAEKSTREQEDTRLANLISAEASNREKQNTALGNKITAETAARTADTKSLTDKLSTEIADAKKYADDKDSALKTEVEKYADDKDSALKIEVENYADDAVAAVTLTGGSTATAEVTVADKTIKANVLLSKATDNIIKSGEGNETGLYAQPGKLTYNSATNKLTFTDENNNPTEITLNSASFIDSILYDESGRTLDITYHTTGQGEGTIQTVKVNLAGLVNKQTVDNTDKTVNIETAATTDNGVSVTQFSAMVNIADNISDNLIETVKDGGKGALVVYGKPIYDKISEVSGSSKDNTDKITKIIEAVGLNSDGTKKGEGDNIQKELDDAQKAAGLTEDGKYIKSDKKYISSANTLAEADKALSDAISNVEGKLNNLTKGGETYTAILSAETDVNTGVDLLKANVRLSQASGQDVNELTRTAIPHSSDYESNLLQVVKAVSEGEQITLDSSVNGLYFGGSIDYGELQGDDNLGD